MQDDREQLVLSNFSWIVAGRLAGVARPHTEEALAMLNDLGVTVLITLTEDELPPDLLTKHRLQAYHSPIRDFSAPSVEQAARIVAKIQDYLEDGQVVAVHCGAGLGRTGTILACYLVADGLPAPAAMATIRTHRPGSIETAAQEAAIGLYEQFLKAR